MAKGIYKRSEVKALFVCEPVSFCEAGPPLVQQKQEEDNGETAGRKEQKRARGGSPVSETQSN